MRWNSRVASVGALLTGLGFVLVTVYQLVLIPGAGIAGAGARDPSRVFAAVATIQFGALVNIALSLALTLFVVGLYERLRSTSAILVPIAAVPGVVAVAFFLANGMVNFTSLPSVAAIYSQDPSAGAPLLAVGLVPRGMQLAAVFAVGLFFLLMSWAALQTARLPKPANYLGLLVGALFIINFVLSPPITLIIPVLGVVWSVWVGVALWREPASAASPTSA